MVDGVILFFIHLAAVWVAWFVVMFACLSLNCFRELIVDRLEFPAIQEIADASLWWSTIIFVGYAMTKIVLVSSDWAFNL